MDAGNISLTDGGEAKFYQLLQCLSNDRDHRTRMRWAARPQTHVSWTRLQRRTMRSATTSRSAGLPTTRWPTAR